MTNLNNDVLNNPDIGIAAKNLGFSYNELCEYFYLLNQQHTIVYISNVYETDINQMISMIEQGKHGSL